MIDYKHAKENTFAAGFVPDGYNGDKAFVAFHFDPKSGHTVCVAKCGCFDTGIPAAVDEKEAKWLLEHHPTAKHIKLMRVGYCEECSAPSSLLDGICHDCR